MANKVILVGNLGKDPEGRATANGMTVTNLTVATSESWKDKATGQRQEKTEWHRVVAFNQLADIMIQYLKKGSKVYIEGKLQTRKWQDQSGQDRYTTEIVASQMEMLSPKSEQAGDYEHQQEPPMRAPIPAPALGPAGPGPDLSGADMDDIDADIPF